uniref:Uncharacterized protein n=1 Tax=Arundo donax TaxID=35708 RepID=A0A0A9F5V2_ARUDO
MDQPAPGCGYSQAAQPLHGPDGDLHAGLAVPPHGADEVVRALAELHLVPPAPQHLGAPGHHAAPVRRRVHDRHVVHRLVVVEHQLVAGAEGPPLGPSSDVELPPAVVADHVRCRRLGERGGVHHE